MKTFEARILTIGAELLKGTVLNTNAKFLASELTQLGFEVTEQNSCPDGIAEIKKSVHRALSSSDLVVLSGGLGPTPDDLTRDALAEYFDVPLKFSQKQFKFIKNYYRKRGKTPPQIVRKEAMFPANSIPLFNRYGIALAFYIPVCGKIVVVLPGVPQELENMFRDLVVPVILKNFPKISKRFPVIAKTVGVGEPEVMTKLGKDFFDDPFDFGIYPSAGEVALRLYAPTEEIARRLTAKIKKRLGSLVYAWSEKTLSQTIGELLVFRKKTLAVAESCTGGSLSSEIAKISGASRYFRGGLTAYHADIKKQIGVTKFALKSGEVNPRVAAELARGVRETFESDYGIGVTGVAGPGGGTKAKPVGLVYISLADARKVQVFKYEFWGSRSQVQEKTVKKCLEILRCNLLR